VSVALATWGGPGVRVICSLPPQPQISDTIIITAMRRVFTVSSSLSCRGILPNPDNPLQTASVQGKA
jgi:hypothetical protein